MGLVAQEPARGDLWAGFLTGLKGFEKFHDPIGQPIYFESPFNDSQLRGLFLKHNFADQSQLGGGDVTVLAVQARLALSERLGFIATKDGYSILDAGALPEDEGWNDLAGGFKYVAIADKQNEFVLTPGIRYQAENGHRGVLQGGCQELSPFVSAAKGWDHFHLLGNLTYRLPLDSDAGNDILQWDLHADLDVLPEQIKGFAPVVELHGLHYLSNGKALPLSVGGLDYANIGSANVKGSSVVWMGVGARWDINRHFGAGATYEFALTDKKDDIMDTRITVDFIARW